VEIDLDRFKRIFLRINRGEIKKFLQRLKKQAARKLMALFMMRMKKCLPKRIAYMRQRVNNQLFFIRLTLSVLPGFFE